MSYKYRGKKVMTPAEIEQQARAAAERIIEQAHEDAKIIRERAYDQAFVLAERDYKTPEEKAEDRARARAAVLNHHGDKRLRAAAFEVAANETAPTHIKAAERLENVEFLLQMGCGTAEAISRSGYQSVGAFERSAYRHGRADLIRTVKHAEDKAAA